MTYRAGLRRGLGPALGLAAGLALWALTGAPQAAERSQAAERACEAAEKTHTVEAYRAVVTRFPGSPCAERAQARMDRLDEEEERRLGLTPEDRRRIQMGLAAAGHDPGPVDGITGRRTREAIRRWQGSRGERVTGYLDADAAKALLAAEGWPPPDDEAKSSCQAAAEAESSASDDAGGSNTVLAEHVRAGLKLRDCPDCPELVVVPPGSFEMGSPPGEAGWSGDEGPVHRVAIAKPFAVGVYEVTFAEWDACVDGGGCNGHRPSDKGWGRGSRPVMDVSWRDAKRYVEWLSSKTGAKYRLPSESEWEYAARAGTKTRYWWGDEVGRNRANCYGCGSRWDGERTAPAGSFSPNGFGLHDVHGNVGEWVGDCLNVGYEGAPTDGCAWESGDCSRRMLRGGSWFGRPWRLRSADRYGSITGLRVGYVGFRVARTLTP